MKKISIVYHSGTGHTEKLAHAVAQGGQSIPNTTVSVHPILGSDIVEGRYKNEAFLAVLDAADAIIFGSPTYMGMVSGQFKCFADATGERWFGQKWANKVAAGFTVSSSPSGDKQGTLLYLSTFAAQHGMIWIGSNIIGYGDAQNRNQLGSFLGVMALSGMKPDDGTPDAGSLATGAYLGQRVAELLHKLN